MEKQSPINWRSVEPNTWLPDTEGDLIEGSYIAMKPDVGVNKSKMYYIENTDGQFGVWGSTVLDDRMSLVKIGEWIRITYNGKQKNLKKQDVKIFKVEVSSNKPKEEIVR